VPHRHRRGREAAGARWGRLPPARAGPPRAAGGDRASCAGRGAAASYGAPRGVPRARGRPPPPSRSTGMNCLHNAAAPPQGACLQGVTLAPPRALAPALARLHGIPAAPVASHRRAAPGLVPLGRPGSTLSYQALPRRPSVYKGDVCSALLGSSSALLQKLQKPASLREDGISPTAPHAPGPRGRPPAARARRDVQEGGARGADAGARAARVGAQRGAGAAGSARSCQRPRPRLPAEPLWPTATEGTFARRHAPCHPRARMIAGRGLRTGRRRCEACPGGAGPARRGHFC
jgi:hypothetical protein